MGSFARQGHRSLHALLGLCVEYNVQKKAHESGEAQKVDLKRSRRTKFCLMALINEYGYEHAHPHIHPSL